MSPVVSREAERWERQAKEATSVIAMIRAMIGEMFGPIASIESADATLLRGPEVKHDGEAILEALGRVCDALERKPAAGRQPRAWLYEGFRNGDTSPFVFRLSLSKTPLEKPFEDYLAKSLAKVTSTPLYD